MNSPAQNANVFGNDNIVVQVIGSGVNVTVQSGRPYLRLTQFEMRTRLAARAESETALLSAYRSDVVALIGRDRDMSGLRHWLDDPAPISIRVLVGAAGRGKTRLALEATRAVSKDGWLAGFVETKELDRFREQGGVEQWRWDKPVLVIVDDAASRAEQLRDWLRELVDASLENRPKLRLLLLERQANRGIGWLATIFGLGDDDNSRAAIEMLDPPEPVNLSPLNELEFRRAVFATLLKRSNTALEAPALAADPEFDRSLAHEKWAGDPLFLMMAGLAAAKAGVRAALSLSRADLALSMARNELDRIGTIGASRGIDERDSRPGAFVRHMAVMATLVQGLSLAEARALATKERKAFGSTTSLDATIAALTDALPEAGAGGGVAPILPDIIGEGAILAWLGPNGGIAASGLDPQARIAEAARVAVAKASSTLVRTAQDFAAAGYAEPVRWLEGLAGARETDLGALTEIANALPEQTLALRELAAELTQRIVHSLQGPAAAEANAGSDYKVQSLYASSLSNLGVRMGELGRREDALAATQEATDIYRRLATERPGILLPYLAKSLDNLGVRMRELGRREDALAATHDATDIYRRLATDSSDAFLPLLAGSLNNLGTSLSELGRREEALAATREATDIYCRLATESPDSFQAAFARSLNNLGTRLSELGRREKALAATHQATDIYRRLATERPDTFLPDFAQSLNNLGASLRELGRSEEALAATQEAVEIRKRLAAERPGAFLLDLAVSLDNLGIHLSDLARREEALVATREATDICRCLAA
jgi:tetratricopeptide (TPR) repeat protein